MASAFHDARQLLDALEVEQRALGMVVVPRIVRHHGGANLRAFRAGQAPPRALRPCLLEGSLGSPPLGEFERFVRSGWWKVLRRRIPAQRHDLSGESRRGRRTLDVGRRRTHEEAQCTQDRRGCNCRSAGSMSQQVLKQPPDGGLWAFRGA